MSQPQHYDPLETRDPEVRERELFRQLAGQIDQTIEQHDCPVRKRDRVFVQSLEPPFAKTQPDIFRGQVRGIDNLPKDRDQFAFSFRGQFAVGEKGTIHLLES